MTFEAIWNGNVVARSDDTVVVEGNHYFPPKDVDMSLLRPSDTTSVCPWKGTSNYYDIVSGAEQAKDVAWYYPEPKPEAESITGRLAFWGDVEVVEV
jgi:uncharacterized protein (DUF427 family)